MTRLIGLGGKLRSGKDTVADYLVEKHGWVKLQMSDPLNEALLILDPLIPHENDELVWTQPYSEFHARVGYVEAKKHSEVRRLLQKLGTEVGRKMIDENVWVDIAKRQAVLWNGLGKDVVITGIRYPNELQMIRDLGGETYWIERPGLEKAGEVSQHSSENSVNRDDFDFTILNDATLDDLYKKVDIVFA